MIGRLKGNVVSQSDDGSCVVDVHGVGYEVFVPLGLLGRLPKPPSEVTLEIHTHVREDAFMLYGFETAEDKAAFRAVLGISGIGPKIALSILTSLRADTLAQAIARQDKNAFKGISGVGKKTVERLLLELRDRLPVATSTVAVATEASPPPPTGPLATVANALVQLGYKQAEAERAVAKITPDADKPVEVLIREALIALA